MAAVVLAATGCSGSGDWLEGTTHGPWEVVYTGYGTVRGDAARVQLRPAVADRAGVTHAALVAHTGGRPDQTVSAKITTNAQLRTGTAPNMWEVGWLLVRYRDPEHFYAVALKPNGWELSKQDTAYPGAQRFLASGNTPTFAVGGSHQLAVTTAGATISATVDGQPLFSYSDTERPYLDGDAALYTEDADVTFSELQAR